MGVIYEFRGDPAGGETFAEAVRAEKAVGRLALPPEVEGHPLRRIGAHAFSDQTDLLEIEIPDTVREIRSYAFYGCERLRRIRLSDSVSDLYDGVIRLCPSLREIEIDLRRGGYRLVEDLLGDTDACLRLLLHGPDGDACLVFPSYADEAREDPWARAIHISIVGCGYRYRQCVSRKGIDYREYDRLFSWAAQRYSDPAAETALARLRYPFRLDASAGEAYRSWLSAHWKETALMLLDRTDTEGLAVLLDAAHPDRDGLDAALRKASENGNTEAGALLMSASGGRDRREPETFTL